MVDQESKKKIENQQKDANPFDAEFNGTDDSVSFVSTSSTDSSIESTITDKGDNDPPKRPNYDPSRIPSSVFSCRGATEWSAASNESLFSITMGNNNNSFSRDHAFVVYKSGELLRLDEVFSHPTLSEDKGAPKKHDLPLKASNAAVDLAPKKAVVVDTNPPVVVEEQGKKKLLNPGDVESSVASEGSGTSNSSFAFPILINHDGKKTYKPLSELPSVTKERSLTKLSEPFETHQGNTPVTPKVSALSSWLSCSFSCCPFRRN